MSQQLPRITRIPQRTPSSPSTARPAGRAAPSSPGVCDRCGAMVGDWDRHEGFHAELATTGRWMQEVSRRLGRLLRHLSGEGE
jgi:hypothetical protein